MTPSELAAGDFSAWLRQARKALLGRDGLEVACGECIGCCSSSYFIHIKPHETTTVGRIPKELLFAAPGMPKSHLLMGYDAQGFCPMLAHGKCTIYQQRPLTCRTYDCRVFTAAGITAGSADKSVINQRVSQWRFSYPTQQDREEHLAVQAAAKFIRERASLFPGGRVPDNPSQLAILALKVYDLFLLKGDEAGKRASVATDKALAAAIVAASRAFDAQILA
ncbi:MAG TPA: YkgJ family cysteine cluster protein [Gammaproteobacteria bacterium]